MQDDLSRQRRINEGRCPTHGVEMIQSNVRLLRGRGEVAVYACTKPLCEFEIAVRPGSKLASYIEARAARFENQSRMMRNHAEHTE
jgi:hypothetical protein